MPKLPKIKVYKKLHFFTFELISTITMKTSERILMVIQNGTPQASRNFRHFSAF